MLAIERTEESIKLSHDSLEIRSVTAPFVGYVLCALTAITLTGCGEGDGGSSSGLASTSGATTPPTATETQSTTVPPTISPARSLNSS